MILLDANILLEMLISGRAKKSVVLEWMQNNSQPYCITMLSVHLVLHFGLKDGLKVSDLTSFLSDYPKIALLSEDYASAMSLLKDKDHEDALQLAIAKRIGASHIVTLDKKFAQTYKDNFHFITP